MNENWKKKKRVKHNWLPTKVSVSTLNEKKIKRSNLIVGITHQSSRTHTHIGHKWMQMLVGGTGKTESAAKQIKKKTSTTTMTKKENVLYYGMHAATCNRCECEGKGKETGRSVSPKQNCNAKMLHITRTAFPLLSIIFRLMCATVHYILMQSSPSECRLEFSFDSLFFTFGMRTLFRWRFVPPNWECWIRIFTHIHSTSTAITHSASERWKPFFIFNY